VNFLNFWKIALATIVMFGAGVTTGGLLVSHVDRSNRNNHRPPGTEFRPPGLEHEPGRGMGMEFPRPRQPDLLNTNFVKDLNEALKLTPEQQSSIEKIIADGQERNHQIWTNNAEQMRGVVQDARRRVRLLLNDDQQKKFEEVMNQGPRRPQGGTNGQPGFFRGPMPRRPQDGTNGPPGFFPGGPAAWRGPSGG
jgi:hypothetical protein